MADTSPAERPEARDRPATRVPTRRKPRDGIATANGKSNEEFLEEFIHPRCELLRLTDMELVLQAADAVNLAAVTVGQHGGAPRRAPSIRSACYNRGT